jgi:hypothetical protein
LKKRNFHDFKEKSEISVEKPEEALLFGLRDTEIPKLEEDQENPLKR